MHIGWQLHRRPHLYAHALELWHFPLVAASDGFAAVQRNWWCWRTDAERLLPSDVQQAWLSLVWRVHKGDKAGVVDACQGHLTATICDLKRAHMPACARPMLNGICQELLA